jgi:uncharacterized membrane protein
MRKAAGIVLKRDGWWVPFSVLLVAISEYWREGRITVGGLFVAALISAAILLITKVPDEIRKLEATRQPL